MTEPRKRPTYEDLLRNRLPDVLGSVNGSETHESIERQLASVDPSEIDETLARSVLTKTSLLIADAGRALGADRALGAGLPTSPSQALGAGLPTSPSQALGAGLPNSPSQALGAGLPTPPSRALGAGLPTPPSRALGAGLPTPPSDRPRSGLQPRSTETATSTPKTFKTNQGTTDMKNTIRVYSAGAEANAQRGTSSVVVMIVAAVCVMTTLVLFQAADRTETQLAQRRMDEMVRAIALRVNPGGAEAISVPQNYDGILAQIEQGTSRSFRPFPQHIQPLAIQSLELDAVALVRAETGNVIETGPREKRRVTLPDGSVLFINEQTTVSVESERRVRLHRGDVFVEVVPVGVANTTDQFVVETAHRSVTALGTKFAVSAEKDTTDVLVSQGKVRVSGVGQAVSAGQQLTAVENVPLEKAIADDAAQAANPVADANPVQQATHAVFKLKAAPRVSDALRWTRDLIVAAERPLVPLSKHAGGAIVVVDPNGQEMQLSLRKFHVDVHIEDGFARTTIDQTYFNHTYSQLEGTFNFPLPPDASLSRLAMYVNGTLMEGGMCERDHARNVFEEIRHTRRDPALLEWVDGSTFKMRVFPLEGRQEKRIILSYSQRLSNDYGRTVYRFPAGHSMQEVRDWSTHVRVKSGADAKWFSSSHLLKAEKSNEGDLLLDGSLRNAALDKDLVVELTAPSEPNAEPGRESVQLSSALHEGHRYLMLRYRPELEGRMERPKRNWVFLFEASADRNPVLARVQLDVIQTLLDNAEHDDTFCIVSASAKSATFRDKPVPCTQKNVKRAVEFLESAHLVGALNLENALRECGKHWNADDASEDWLVHVGSAVPVLGERDQADLIKQVPQSVRYVGVGIGKSWSRPFMKSAAAKTGGHFTQINPDEKITWRAIELLSILNAPRLLNIEVAAAGDSGVSFLGYGDTIAQGQEICAIARIPRDQKLPKRITVKGQIDGEEKPWSANIKVQGQDVAENVLHLPRTWARLEIDRLVASGAEAAKAEIIELSKQMYVMSPFTSLLVLETEAMYQQYGVDRGRKDHWALYPAPAQIKVEAEQGPVVANLREALEQARQRQATEQATLNRNLSAAVEQQRSADELTQLRADLKQRESAIRELDEQLAFVARNEVASPVNAALDGLVVRGLLPRGLNAATHEALSLRTWGMHTNEWYDNGGVTRLGRFGLPQLLGLEDESRVTSYSVELARDDFISLPQMWGRTQIDGTRNTDLYFDSSQRLQLAVARQIWDARASAEDDPETALVRLKATRGAVTAASGIEPGLQIRLREQLASVIADVKRLPGVTEARVIRTQERIAGLESELQVHGLIDRETNGLGFVAGSMPIRYRAADDWRRVLSERESVSRQMLGENRFDTNGNGVLDFGRVNPVDDVRRWSKLRLTDSIDRPVQFFAQPFGLSRPQLTSDSDFTDSWENDGWLKDRIPANGRRPAGPWTRAYNFRSLEAPVWLRDGVVNSLAEYCPALETTNADIQAVLADAIDPEKKIPQGKVDAKARRLIEQARGRGWESLQVGDARSATSFQVVYNGSAQFHVARKTQDGLREEIVCDGSTLWHLYPELGIGTQRPFTRFHELDVQSLIPWHVPSADELSRGANVELVGKNTIRVTPLKATKAEADDQQSSAHEDADETTAPLEFVVEFEFNKAGALIERRILDARKNQVLARMLIGEDGLVRFETLVDGKTKTHEHKFARTLHATAPRLVPETSGLVVLPLPFRTANFVREQLAKKSVAPATAPSDQEPQKDKPADETPTEKKPVELSSEDALRLVAAHFAEQNPQELLATIQQNFYSKNDHRIGFAVLLASVTRFNEVTTEATDKHAKSPVALFLRQFALWSLNGDRNQEFVVADDACEFLRDLATTHNAWLNWATGRATKDRTAQQIATELDDTLDFVDSYGNRDVAWELVTFVFAGLESQPASKADHFKRLAQSIERFAAHGSNLTVTPLLLRVRLKAGQQDVAIKELRDYMSDLVETLGYIPHDADLRNAFANPPLAATDGDKLNPSKSNIKAWNSIITDAARTLIEHDRRSAVLRFAIFSWDMGDRELAESLFDLAIEDVNLDAKPELGVFAIEYLRHTQDWKRADSFVTRIPITSAPAKTAQFWRTAADIATELKRHDESQRRLELALDIEFAHLPPDISLPPLRTDYVALLDRFEGLLKVVDLKNSDVVRDLVSRIVKAGDRWRSLDPAMSDACFRTARLLDQLGEKELAWSYWTTPLADQPRNSELWKSLAIEMNNKDFVDRSHTAYATAFECEPTNPEILWHHAATLKARGRQAEGVALLKQIADGQWQPRFSGIQQQAKDALR